MFELKKCKKRSKSPPKKCKFKVEQVYFKEQKLTIMIKKFTFIALFCLCGCAAPDVQYRYVCRELYLSADAYDRIAVGPNGAADIERLFEHGVWCDEINNPA